VANREQNLERRQRCHDDFTQWFRIVCHCLLPPRSNRFDQIGQTEISGDLLQLVKIDQLLIELCRNVYLLLESFDRIAGGAVGLCRRRPMHIFIEHGLSSGPGFELAFQELGGDHAAGAPLVIGATLDTR
jgi:hypothetical protein